MKKEQHGRKKHFRNMAIIIVLSVFITFLFGGFSSDWKQLFENILYGISIGVSIAMGSGVISRKMMSGGDWMDYPVRKFTMVVLTISVFIIVDVLLINSLWFTLVWDGSFSQMLQNQYFIIMTIVEFMIGIIIYLIIVAAHFAKSLNEYYLEVQKQKSELNHYKFATLKNQVNPHFLFNSLNVLSALIYKDVEKADDFIGKLSNIYRYVLDVQEEEVVSLNQEIAFAKDYLYLQSIRFGDNLKYDIKVSSNKMIVPMALQILIENALKHNVISAEHSLLIRISNDDKYLVVSNNVRLKDSNEPSHELGLDNIKGRYKFLTDMEVKISQSNNQFEVSLPLLSVK